MRFNQTSPLNNFDIFEVIRKTFIFLWQNKDSFINLCLPGIIILSILSTVLSLIYSDSSNINLDNSNGPIVVTPEIILPILITLPVVVFFIICFSIGWHRFYLISNDPCSLKESLLWNKRHTRYLYSTITIFLLVIMLAMFGLIFSFLGPIGILLTLVLIIIFYARFSFVLPAAAIDNQFKFSDSWQITKGNTLKIAAVIFFIWFMTISATILLGQIVQSIFNQPLSFIGIFVVSFVFRFLSFISLGLVVTALSIIFSTLNKAKQNSLDLKV